MFLTLKSGRKLKGERSHDTFFWLVGCNIFFIISKAMNSVAEAISGSGLIHKSKLNTNGTFSVGKTWRLAELRALSVISVCILAAFLHQLHIFTPALIALGFRYYLVKNISMANGT